MGAFHCPASGSLNFQKCTALTRAGTGPSSTGIVFNPSVIGSLTCPGWEVSVTLQAPASVFARWLYAGFQEMP